MDRDEFMELVYETFTDEPDNVLANGIIEAADAYAEHEKAQLSQQGTTKDTISRQAAIDAAKDWYEGLICGSVNGLIKRLNALPSVQPEQREGERIAVHPIQSDDSGAYMCSKCKTGMWEIRPSSYHYCPNCGAKMKGAKHETD